MNKWKIVTGVILIFVFGVLIGVLGTGVYMKKYRSLVRKKPEERTAFILKKLEKELVLTDSQKTEIEKILIATQQKIQGLFLQHRNEVRKLIDESHIEMKKHLDPDQSKKLDELRRKFEKRRKKLKPFLDHPPPE